MTPLQHYAVQVRNRLRNPKNAVPDTGFHFKNGRPVRPMPCQAPAKPIRKVLEPVPPAATIAVNVYPVTFSTHDRIIQVVCKTFDVRLRELMSKRCNAWVVQARQSAMALTVLLTKYSYPKVGKIFDRDHTTIMHAARKMKRHLDEIEAHMPPESITEWAVALKDRLTDPEELKDRRERWPKGRTTHCQNGHAFDRLNTIESRTGKRKCRACATHKDQLRYHRKKAERLAARNTGAAGARPLIHSGEGGPAVTPDCSRPGSLP